MACITGWRTDLFKEEGAGEKLRPVNPLMQLPTLVLPNGQIMTESAARDISRWQRNDGFGADWSGPHGPDGSAIMN
jgi:hypothetical protein